MVFILPHPPITASRHTHEVTFFYALLLLSSSVNVYFVVVIASLVSTCYSSMSAFIHSPILSMLYLFCSHHLQIQHMPVFNVCKHWNWTLSNDTISFCSFSYRSVVQYRNRIFMCVPIGYSDILFQKDCFHCWFAKRCFQMTFPVVSGPVVLFWFWVGAEQNLFDIGMKVLWWEHGDEGKLKCRPIATTRGHTIGNSWTYKAGYKVTMNKQEGTLYAYNHMPDELPTFDPNSCCHLAIMDWVQCSKPWRIPNFDIIYLTKHTISKYNVTTQNYAKRIIVNGHRWCLISLSYSAVSRHSGHILNFTQIIGIILHSSAYHTWHMRRWKYPVKIWYISCNYGVEPENIWSKSDK